MDLEAVRIRHHRQLEEVENSSTGRSGARRRIFDKTSLARSVPLNTDHKSLQLSLLYIRLCLGESKAIDCLYRSTKMNLRVRVTEMISNLGLG